jgi:hypothetical protein
VSRPPENASTMAGFGIPDSGWDDAGTDMQILRRK